MYIINNPSPIPHMQVCFNINLIYKKAHVPLRLVMGVQDLPKSLRFNRRRLLIRFADRKGDTYVLLSREENEVCWISSDSINIELTWSKKTSPQSQRCAFRSTEAWTTRKRLIFFPRALGNNGTVTYILSNYHCRWTPQFSVNRLFIRSLNLV